jgi:UDP-glucose 4-epimerase
MAKAGNRRILVTGARGIVGRGVLERLKLDGWDVVPLVSSATCEMPEGAIVADLTAAMPLVPPCQYVVHLAAALSHDRRYPDPEKAGELTRQIDHIVLQAAADWKAKVLYASTCSLYVPTDEHTKHEAEVILRTDTAYRLAKRGTELKLLSEGGHVVFRLSAPYGPGMFASTVLPRFIETARRGGEIEVWGSGSREQNFVYATDVADFVARALSRDASGLYNVAGDTITMRELAEVVVSIVGQGSCRLSGRADPLDSETARYSIQAARHDLGWRATIPINVGIELCKHLEFRQ